MKVLVTGGAGFIGANLSVELLRRGDDVVILDDFNDRYDPRLKRARIANLFEDTKKPKVFEGDICDRRLIDELFNTEKFDKVVHLAAWASVLPSIENPYIYTAVNVDGTVNILEAARKNGVQNIVSASSSSVYGGIQEFPFKETQDVSRPISPYAATKLAGEAMCATWNHLYGIPISCLRFFTVYGPWGRPEMAIFKFTKAILNNEPVEMRGRETQRDFTYIDDIVQGIIATLDKPNGYSIYNLGENDGVLLPRLISALENALDKKAIINEVPLPPGDIPKTLADITKAKEELGYRPTTLIENGVKHFVDWYKNWYVKNLQ